MKKLKICGITRFEDALLCSNQKAWAVGFIFVESSPRFINPENTAKITSQLPDSIEKVGVFLDSGHRYIVNTAKQAGLTMIQLLGNETPEFIVQLKTQISIPIIKAIRIFNEQSLSQIPDFKGIADYILLDSYSDKAFGGTGESFDWELAIEAKSFGVPVILAGGLSPENIKEAIESVQPYACDLSSGVESSKGIKDAEKLKKLFENASI